MTEFIVKYYVEMLLTISATALTTGCIWLYNRFRSISESNLALLHNELYQLSEFYIKRKWASVNDKVNIEFLYKPYKKLGGNGTCANLYEQCMNLPIFPPGGME